MAKKATRKQPVKRAVDLETERQESERKALKAAARSFRHLRELANAVMREKRKADAAIVAVAELLSRPASYVPGRGPVEP